MSPIDVVIHRHEDCWTVEAEFCFPPSSFGFPRATAVLCVLGKNPLDYYCFSVNTIQFMISRILVYSANKKGGIRQTCTLAFDSLTAQGSLHPWNCIPINYRYSKIFYTLIGDKLLWNIEQLFDHSAICVFGGTWNIWLILSKMYRGFHSRWHQYSPDHRGWCRFQTYRVLVDDQVFVVRPGSFFLRWPTFFLDLQVVVRYVCTQCESLSFPTQVSMYWCSDLPSESHTRELRTGVRSIFELCALSVSALWHALEPTATANPSTVSFQCGFDFATTRSSAPGFFLPVSAPSTWFEGR